MSMFTCLPVNAQVSRPDDSSLQTWHRSAFPCCSICIIIITCVGGSLAAAPGNHQMSRFHFPSSLFHCESLKLPSLNTLQDLGALQRRRHRLPLMTHSAERRLDCIFSFHSEKEDQPCFIPADQTLSLTSCISLVSPQFLLCCRFPMNVLITGGADVQPSLAT